MLHLIRTVMNETPSKSLPPPVTVIEPFSFTSFRFLNMICADPGMWVTKKTDHDRGDDICVFANNSTVVADVLNQVDYVSKDCNSRSNSNIPRKPGRTFVAQRYIVNPLLIEGYKFDIRQFIMVSHHSLTCNALILNP